MRQVSSVIADRLERQVQTISENANPATYFRVMRHEIPLAEKQYLEYSRVGRTNGITDSDVAVCHPRFGKADEDIWVSYIVNSKLKVRHAKNVEALAKSDWVDYSYTPDAVACSIAFDSEVKHNARGIWEFVTDKYPWVFWVTPEGALRAKMCTPIGVMEIELANANVTDVSAVRGPAGEYGNWDLGLTVFFVMGGNVYYRQYIGGEWYDAEQVRNDVLDGLTVSKIKAFNTWDYRSGLQILTSDNKMYELFSYTEGIGTRGTEHIQLSGISATAKLKGIEYYNFFNSDHVAFNGISSSVDVIYAHSAVPVSVANVETWNTTIEVEFDYPNTSDGLSPSMFTLVDTNNINYICQECSVSGKILTLTFEDFNRAVEASGMTVSYTKPASGGLLSPAVQTDSFSRSFVPTHLTAPLVNQPDFHSASNSADGMEITVVLTEDMTNADVSNMKNNFSVELEEYTRVPEGSLETTTRSIASVSKVDDDELLLTVNKPNFSSAIGNITVKYDGLGGLRGLGGPAPAFDGEFVPTGLTWKGHQNDVEHISFSGIEASATLIPITYYDAQANPEHIAFNDISASITLTNVHDL